MTGDYEDNKQIKQGARGTDSRQQAVDGCAVSVEVAVLVVVTAASTGERGAAAVDGGVAAQQVQRRRSVGYRVASVVEVRTRHLIAGHFEQGRRSHTTSISAIVSITVSTIIVHKYCIVSTDERQETTCLCAWARVKCYTFVRLRY